MLKLPLIAASAGLVACSSIDRHTPPPPDWPALTIHEHVVSWGEVWERCKPYTPPGMWPLACAEFRPPRCDIFAVSWVLPSVWEHERLHCAGYDHPGSTAMREWWESFKRGGGL